MCKEAVDRAAVYISIKDDPEKLKAFSIYTLGCNEWDDANPSDELLNKMADTFNSYNELIKEEQE